MNSGDQLLRDWRPHMLLGVVVLVCALVLLVLGLKFWDSFTGAPEPTRARDVATVATQAPQIESAPVEWIVPPKPLKTYAPKAKAAVKLPQAVQADAAAVVLESSRIAASDRPQTVTAVLDTETGETRQYVVDEPLPWLDTTVRSDAGVYLGLKRGEPTIRAQARAQIAQVKELRLGALASADMPLNGERPGVQAEYFIGVGAWLQW
ncbi:hypothetical protein [Methyloversatilis discipulorum]|uniref:hypothetical protein n=1 Tax=Methyloversatilis discipulorum TaxID=1119528 RepID=UPI000366E0BC|nr:hypothetical protein [Methyloversatilis discipulorum]